jgi:TonB-linked SusC/RagA family outer membrane protein
MRLATIILLTTCLSVSASTYSQRVTISEKDVPLEKVFKQMKKQTGYVFFYDEDWMKQAKKVTVNAVNLPMEDVLKICFKNQPLSFSVIGKTIVLEQSVIPVPNVNFGEVPMPPPPPFTVTGKITDSEGVPLEGVSVLLKKTGKGVTTLKDGSFSIQVPQGGDVLVFSYAGFENTELRVTKPGALNIKLRLKENNVEEVVVVGYGSARKKDLTGSVASVSVADIKKAPVASFEEALGGRVAGVQVTSQSGQPGDGFQIAIRGNNSVTQDNSPLYVIDGFPIEGFNNSLINPAEIESIDILKDASATAIYGARGANGVVLITTKKGKDGPPQINFQSFLGSARVSKTIPLLNAYEFIKLQLDISPATATQQYLTRSAKKLEDYKSIEGVDMQDKIFRNAPSSNHYINIRGGNASTKYSFSGNIFQQDGVIINSGYKRYQVNTSIDQKISQKIKVGLNIAYTTARTYGTISAANAQDASSGRAGGSISPSGFLMYNVWGYRPITGTSEDLTEEIVDPEAITGGVLAYNVNPYVQLMNELKEKRDENVIINSNFDWTVVKNLRFRSTFGINQVKNVFNTFNNSKTSSGNPITSPNGILVNGSVENRVVNNWSNENTLTYSNVFHKIHSLNVLAGFSQQGNTFRSNGFRAIQVPNESLGISGLDEGTVSAITSGSSLWQLRSFLGRVNYALNSKYLFTANFRTDGSSRFSESNRWAYFPSGSVAWRFSDEKFLKDFVKAIKLSDGKFRVGYGRTGNNRVNDFAYLSVISTSGIGNTYSFNNGTPGTSAVISTVGNKDLKWETTNQTNIGVDLSFFDKRLLFTADVYKKETNDLLINTTLPAISGYGSLLRNIGKVENKGLELTLNYKVVESKNFNWLSNINISFNRNKIVKLSDNQEAITFALGNRIAGATPNSISKVNNPIGTFYGYQWAGVYQYSDFDHLANGSYLLKANVPTNGNTRTAILPGDIKYSDLNGDGIVNASDNTIIGNPNAKHYGGFNNNIQYKDFELNIFFQWSYGNEIFNINRMIFEGGGEFPSNLNQYNTVVNRWTPENSNSLMPRIRPGSNVFTNVFSSRFVEDGSYLRLKTLNFAYNLPGNLLRKVFMKSGQIYFSAQNLITWTNYTGYDPEVSVVSNALAPGVDFSAYPRNKIYTLGLNFTF